MSELTKKYRLGVGIFLINSDNKVFVGQRNDMFTDAWQMPQGGIDKGEDPLTSAFRELEEEVGTRDVELIAESSRWYYYDLPNELIPKFWHGEYVGQKQKWFLMKLNGSDEKINIRTDNPEFQKWQWIDPLLLPEMVVDFKKSLYKNVLNEFSTYL